MNNHDRRTQWVNTVLQELSNLEDGVGIKILHKCGGTCAKSSDLLEGARKIRENNTGVENPHKLFKLFKEGYYNSPNFSMEGEMIHLVFDDCTCPMVKEGVSNPYLCNCTVGYTYKIFETLFNRKVSVELEQSILKGDKICKQVIRLVE